jgi:hypothetical protein
MASAYLCPSLGFSNQDFQASTIWTPNTALAADQFDGEIQLSFVVGSMGGLH